MGAYRVRFIAINKTDGYGYIYSVAIVFGSLTSCNYSDYIIDSKLKF